MQNENKKERETRRAGKCHWIDISDPETYYWHLWFEMTSFITQ